MTDCTQPTSQTNTAARTRVRPAGRHADASLVAQLVEIIPSPVFYKDTAGRFLGCNRGFELFTGVSREKLIGRTVYELWPKDLADRYDASDRALIAHPGTAVCEAPVVYADGCRHDVVFHKATFTTPKGELGGVVGVMWDITEHRRLQRVLQDRLQFDEQLLETIPSPAFYKDVSLRYLGCNRAFEEFVGCPRERLVGKTVYDVWPADLAALYDAADRALLAHPGRGVAEAEILHADGTRHDVVIHRATFLRVDETVGGIVGVMWDVTARKHAEEALHEVLRSQALHDPLTGLFNRRFLEEALEHELARAQHSGSSVAIVMADVDHFKRINDTLGHGCGDEVLRALSELLASHFRKSDFVCRYGGEEFTIVLPDTHLDEAIQRTDAVRTAIRQLAPSRVDAPVGPIALSFGVAAYPAHGTTPSALLAAADQALLRAKQLGRDRVVSAQLPNGGEQR